MMYSAESSNSSIVAAIPRFSSTGLRCLPNSRSRLKFCMLRAPTCRMSEYCATTDLRLVHHFAHYQKPVAVGRLAQHLQPRLSQPLKCVWRTARLEGSAANHGRAGFGHCFRAAVDLVPGFHAARTSHHHHAFAANIDASDFDNSAARPETATDQLVGRRDAVRVLDALHYFENAQVELVLAAHAAQHRVEHARGPVYIEAQFHQAIDHTLNLRLAGAFLHYDYHLFVSAICRHPIPSANAGWCASRRSHVRRCGAPPLRLMDPG